MGPFFDHDMITQSFRQPLENFAIYRAANIHRQIVVLAEACLAKELLEQPQLCFLVARPYDDEGIGVVFYRAEDVLHDPASPHTAKLRVHDRVIHIQAGFDVEGKGVHVRVLERRTQALAVTNYRFNSHGEKACLCLHSQVGENMSSPESSLTRPCLLLIIWGVGNTIAFEISQLLLIRRELREEGDNFAEESAHRVAEKRRARERVTDFVPLPLGANQLRSSQNRELLRNYRLRES